MEILTGITIGMPIGVVVTFLALTRAFGRSPNGYQPQPEEDVDYDDLEPPKSGSAEVGGS